MGTDNGEKNEDASNGPEKSLALAEKVDPETQQTKVPYPKSVAFIVSNEFCERFSFYGMRTVLSVYLVDKLNYTESTATVIFHAFVMLVYFFPVLGAILADSFLGKFRTILYLSIVYSSGNVVLSLAATPPLNFPMAEISILGLALIAFGSGGIKPCVAAFGGDQFKRPEQDKQLEQFFSWFYFSINSGSLLSIALTPILKQEIQCFGDEDCYTVAFVVPGILMIMAVIIFALGKRLYIIKGAQANMIVQASKCIGNAISNKIKSKGNKKDHWLDYAEEDYGAKLVTDVKAVLRVLLLYLPLPFFWALYEQQGSGWTFMARRMDGDIGFYNIPEEQIQIANPLLILIFIPLFTYIIYPLLAKCNLLKTPLQRLTAGGCMCSISFVVSALLCMEIESRLPILPADGNGQIRIYNGLNCDIKLSPNNLMEETVIKSLEDYTKIDIPINGDKVSFTYNVNSEGCSVVRDGTFEILNGKAQAYYFNRKNEKAMTFEDDVAKSDNSKPLVRFLINRNDKVGEFRIKFKSGDDVILDVESSDKALHEVSNTEYKMHFGDNFKKDVKFRSGGVYTVVGVATASDKFEVKELIVTEPNSVSSLLLLPQYVIMTAAEIMFSVTGLEFSYSQAPTSMKSVVQACWLLTSAFGNLIIIIIESIGTFEKHSHTFFLYAGLLIVDMAVFTLMAMRYTYVKREDVIDEYQATEPLKKEGFDNMAFKKNDE